MENDARERRLHLELHVGSDCERHAALGLHAEGPKRDPIE